MALGKNLKKKNLIPSEPVKKAEKEKTSSLQPPKKLATQTASKAADNSVTEESKQVSPKKKEPNERRIETQRNSRESEFRHLDKQEFDRRVSLHNKFRKQVEAMNNKKVHLIIFKIRDEEFAIEIDKIREVVPTPTISKMPQSPSYVPGIATIRGKAIVTIDLTKKFGLVSLDEESEHFAYTMIVSTQKFTIGILIHEVPVNQIVDGNNIQSTAEDFSETTLDETYVIGMLKLDGRVIFLMDIDELVEGDRLKNRVSASVNFAS